MPNVPDRVAARRRALGALIRQRRFEAGLTQAALARAASTARSYISDVERGVIGCSVDWLYEIAAACDVRPADLVPDDPAGPRTPPDASVVGTATTTQGAHPEEAGP